MERDDTIRSSQQAAANKQLIDQLIGEENLIAEAGEQKYYLLSQEDMKKLQHLPDANQVEFSLSRDRDRPQAAAEGKQTGELQQLAARLQNLSQPQRTAARGSQPYLAEGGTCEYGEEAYLLQDQHELEKFLSQYTSGQEVEYNLSQRWAKRGMITEKQLQVKLLTDIISRLQTIEEQLKRLESYLRPSREAMP